MVILMEVGTHLVPVRLEGNEPRDIRRKSKHCLFLKMTRDQWIVRHAA